MFHPDSALFSGLRGGTFLCTLTRLNRRLKRLLFHSLLQQEVHFFEKINTGETENVTQLLFELGFI